MANMSLSRRGSPVVTWAVLGTPFYITAQWNKVGCDPPTPRSPTSLSVTGQPLKYPVHKLILVYSHNKSKKLKANRQSLR